MLSFKAVFSLSSFTLIKRLFSSTLLSAINVVSSAYLKMIFLLAILIPACASSSPTFLMMYSACRLNKHGDNIQPWCTPFPIWNQSFVPCPVQTVASWPAYRLLRRQIRWSGISISLRIFLFVVIYTIICGKFWKRWKYQTTWLDSWETYMQVRKQQLELDLEQQSGPNRKRSTSRLYIVTLLI